MFHEINAGIICEKCFEPYQPAGIDEGIIYYGPTCECWLKNAISDLEKRQNPVWYEEVEHFIDEDFINERFDDFDSINAPIFENYAQYQGYEDRQAENNFARLKEKYWISFYNETFSSSPLYNILLRLEAWQILSENEIKWLKIKRLFPVVAQGYFQKYQAYRNDWDPIKNWDLIKASRYFRKAFMFDKSLEITNNFITSDKKIMSAILTTRGAAFKDIGKLDYAEECASKAKNMLCTKYVYALLGSIYFRRGQYSRATEYFQDAIKLGATFEDIDKDIKNEINHSDEIERKLMAEYLLAEDPKRFAWVSRYLV